LGLTYTEIEQQKNTRIVVFFLIVVLFYFLTALLLTFLVKGFLVYYTREFHKMGMGISGGQMVFVLCVAVIAAAIHIAHSVGHAMNYVESNLSAEGIDPRDRYHRLFARIVDEVNVATGNKYRVKAVVIPTVALNAFSMAGTGRRAIIGVTEGLLSKLTRQQLEAVTAHEMAHVVSGDSLQTTIGCALFGVYAAMAGAAKVGLRAGGRIRRPGRGGGGILILLLLVYLTLGLTQFFYRLVRLALSRERELRADAVAVRLTRDPVSLSEALQRIANGWRGIGYIDRNLDSLFIVNPAVDPRDESEGFLADLLSTHPPIRRRIAILAHMAHVSVKDIEASVKSQVERSEQTREVPAGEEKAIWSFADAAGNWQGPFTSSQAVVLGWLTPETPVRRPGSDETRRAADEPLLADVFASRKKQSGISGRDCPVCSQKLVVMDYEGVPVEHCVFCGGVLVGWRQLPRIGVRTERGFDDRVRKLARYAEKDRAARARRSTARRISPFKCPGCGSTMERGDYSAVYPVEVDRCMMCGLIWFDKNELELFQYMLESKGIIPDGWD
jgi:heat shock protein HtpX